MEKEQFPYTAHEPVKMRWSPMVVLSAFLHLFIFSAFLFVPESFPTKKPYAGIVYDVRLVDMPRGGGAKSGGARSSKKSGKKVVKKATPTKRITAPKKKAKPVVIAKRTLKKETAKIEKPKASPSKLIDQAISKIERKVKKEDKGQHVDQAIAKLEQRAKGSEETGAPQGRGGVASGGMPMMIYRAEAEEWIKSNWSYPVALDSQKDLEAVVVLMVKRDGSILKNHFEKRSSRTIFDESVMKAIERSDPLPPFPEGYRKSHEEFIISFNLKDLQEQ